MLVKHSMNTILEVLISAIARGLVVDHETPLACRKFLFKKRDFEEEE